MNASLNASLKDSLATQWRMIIALGGVMVILGILALAAPVVATLAVDIYVGWLFLFSGVLGLVAAFSARLPRGFPWILVTALLSLVAGAVLVWKPAQGAISLTLLLTAFFIAEGFFQAITSVSHRETLGSSWGWMLVSGIADLALAAIILLGWPTSASWALGIIVGVNLITSGWAIVMAAMAAHEIAKGAASLAKPAHS